MNEFSSQFVLTNFCRFFVKLAIYYFYASLFIRILPLIFEHDYDSYLPVFFVFVIASIKSEIYLVDEWFFYFTCGNLIYESQIIFMMTSGHLLRHLIIRKMKNVGWYSFIYLTDCSWCSIRDVEIILTFYWWCFGGVLEDFLESP